MANLVKTAHDYIEAGDKEKLRNRLRRIERQVRGVQRMLDEDDYCVDVLTQLGSIVSATERVALLVWRDHAERCVRRSIENGRDTQEKMDEMLSALERFLRV